MPVPTFNIDMIARQGWATIVVPSHDIPPKEVRPYVGQRIEFVCGDYGLDGEAYPGEYRWSPVDPHKFPFKWLPDRYLKFDVAPARPMRFS